MALKDITSSQAVLDAIAEHDRLGQQPFLDKYGFGKAREYFLEYEGKLYDSKAIAGVAHKYQFQDRGPLRSHDFVGGYATVEKFLRRLRFDVRAPKRCSTLGGQKEDEVPSAGDLGLSLDGLRVVIQCARSKADGAPSLRAATNRPVKFVAQPLLAPSDDEYSYARPDDRSDVSGNTWREDLAAYNAARPANPSGLLPAHRLYRNGIYRRLVNVLGAERVFILSAGWGLVRADYLLPSYDITFRRGADVAPYMRRSMQDRFEDFCQMPKDGTAHVLFFGGKAYVPLLVRLTGHLTCKTTVFYFQKRPIAPSTRLQMVGYSARRSTNWQYDCADDFLKGRLACALNGGSAH